MKIGLIYIYPFNKELAADLVRGGGGAGVCCWLLPALLLLADLAVTVGGGRGVQRAVVLQLPGLALIVVVVSKEKDS